jgi:hypothetical protein
MTLRIIATHGAVGVMPVRFCKGFSDATVETLVDRGPLPPVPFDGQIPKYVELMKTGTKQRIQAEGPGSSIGDGTPFEVMKQWAEAGAISQCSTDVYIVGGVTNSLRMIA